MTKSELRDPMGLLLQAARVDPVLMRAARQVEELLRVRQYDSADMYEAWEAGFAWCADRVELEDGELFVPHDEPCTEGRDHACEFGSWLCDFDAEREAGDD